jgi:TPR repeat protein
MSLSLFLRPIALTVVPGFGLVLPAQAKFLSPPDVLKEPAVTALVEILKKAKTPEESKPAFAGALKLATEASSAERQFFLGYLYQYGLGTDASLENARAAYEKSAADSFAAAKNNLGLLNLASGGDPAKAVAMVEDLANTGYAGAQCSMGQLYLDGVPVAGIIKDLEKARVWFERASAGGDPDSAWTLAMMTANQPNLTEAQAKQAIDLMEQAMKAGHLPALVEYGTRLVMGNGLQADVPRGLPGAGR